MWQAIQSAADAVLANDLALANAILEVRYKNRLSVICNRSLTHTRRVVLQLQMDFWRLIFFISVIIFTAD